MIQQLLSQFGRQIRFPIIEERRNIVVQSAFSPSLIVEKEWLIAAQHDVARLEITIQKKVVVSA